MERETVAVSKKLWESVVDYLQSIPLLPNDQALYDILLELEQKDGNYPDW